MAKKSDIPRASASLRSITPMVRITSGPGVDSARVRASKCVMLVPPEKEEYRTAALWITPCRDHYFNAGSTMGSRNTWTAHDGSTAMLAVSARGRAPKLGDALKVSNMRLVGYNDLQAPPPAI